MRSELGEIGLVVIGPGRAGSCSGAGPVGRRKFRAEAVASTGGAGLVQCLACGQGSAPRRGGEVGVRAGIQDGAR